MVLQAGCMWLQAGCMWLQARCMVLQVGCMGLQVLLDGPNIAYHNQNYEGGAFRFAQIAAMVALPRDLTLIRTLAYLCSLRR